MTSVWVEQYMPEIVVAACAVTSCILQVFSYSCRNWRQYGRVQQTMGPKIWPILGTAVEHLRNYYRLHDWLLSYFEKLHTISAPVYFGQGCYYTVDMENIKYILKTNFKNFPKGELFHERMEVVLGDGIFNCDGEKWKQQRKNASADFSLRSVRDLSVVVFKDEALKLVGLLHEIEQKGLSMDLQDLFMRMTLESIGKVGFGVEIGSLPWQLPLPENAFATAFDMANEIVCRRFIDPFWKLKRALNIAAEAELERSVKVLDSFTYGVIAQRRLEITADRSEQDAGHFQAPKLDIISRYLERSGEGHDCTDYKFLRDIVLNFVIAGRDSTAVTLSWLVYSIMEKPEIARRLYDELRSFETRKSVLQPSEVEVEVGTTGDCYEKDEAVREFAELLTYDSVKAEELPYLHAVVSETIRLFPAVPMNPKGIKEDDVLPDGTHLKQGEIIFYSAYCMARMTYIWGPDAKEFQPERWLHDGKFQPESEFKFTAFQAGQRMCLGKDSAYLQLKMTAAILCRFFEFHRVEGHDVHYRMMAILSMASGLKVTVRRLEETKIDS